MTPGRGAWRGLVAALLVVCAGSGHAADVFRGGRLYAQHCAGCHGADGIAVLAGAPNFARQERLAQPDPLLMNSIKRGKGPMPAFQAILRDQEVLDIIAFVRTLRK